MDRKSCFIRQLKLISHDAETSDLPIRFFEYEWITKKSICQSMLDNKLNKSNRLFARKTVIKTIFNEQSKVFLDDNHIQGNIQSSVKLGLFYKDSLVSLMTFGKSRYNKNYEWELLRFCNKKGLSVVGGASKLLSYFEKTYKPKSLISYANKRWSNGKLYDRLGFTYLYDTPPSYYYYKLPDIRLYHRTCFQKHKLSYLLTYFNPELTEVQNMLNNGYRQIFDQGQKVYVKTYN